MSPREFKVVETVESVEIRFRCDWQKGFWWWKRRLGRKRLLEWCSRKCRHARKALALMVLETILSVDVLAHGASRITVRQREMILVIFVDVLHGVLHRGVAFAALRVRAMVVALRSRRRVVDVARVGKGGARGPCGVGAGVRW